MRKRRCLPIKLPLKLRRVLHLPCDVSLEDKSIPRQALLLVRAGEMGGGGCCCCWGGLLLEHRRGIFGPFGIKYDKTALPLKKCHASRGEMTAHQGAELLRLLLKLPNY